MASSTTSFLFHRTHIATRRSEDIQSPDPVTLAKKYAVERDQAGDFRTYVLVNSKEEEARRIAANNQPRQYFPQANLGGDKGNIQIAAQSGKKIVLTVGCQGKGEDAQKKVADKMEEVVKRLQSQDYIVACVLVLGDNVYDNGASSPDDPNINKCCENIYTTARTPHLAKIPFFYLQGNHDQNRHRANLLPPFNKPGIDTGLNQVAHSYLPSAKYKTVQDKINLYSRKLHPGDDYYILNAEDLEHHNMMGRAFSLIIDDMRFYCMDSNTLVSDTMDYERGKQNTQVEWLVKNYRNPFTRGDHKNILALHCPPKTVCKRKFGNDIPLYLDDAHLGNKKGSYNKEIKAVLDKYDLSFPAIFAAHDHGISYFNDGRYRIMVSAGGGDKAHERLGVEEHENKALASYLDKTGFVLLESDPNDKFKLDFAIYTTETTDFPLMFTNKDTKPVRNPQKPEDKIRMAKLCLAQPSVIAGYSKPRPDEVLKLDYLYQAALDAYNDFMKIMNNRPMIPKKNNKTKIRPDLDYDEMKLAHELLAYISRPYVEDYDDTLIKIAKIVKLPYEREPFDEKRLSSHMAHEFLNYFYEGIWKKLGESMERKGIRVQRTCNVM